MSAVDWKKVLPDEASIRWAILGQCPEMNDHQLEGLTHLFQAMAMDHYNRGMLQVQTDLVYVLNLKHLLGSGR